MTAERPARERLRDLLAERAISHGQFTLASGKTSNYYINSKKILFHGPAIAAVGELIEELTRDIAIDAVGGLEVGAIPMAASVVLAFHRVGRPVEGFFVRKQAKGHGSLARIEGVFRPGDRVVILDDVLTTGESAANAASAVEEAGGVVARVVCIVDRLQGAAERLKGYDFRPLFTVRDYGIEPETGS